MTVDSFLNGGELVAPVGTDFLGMEYEHGTADVGILGADIEDGMARRHINGGQEDSRTASLPGSLDDGISVLRKLLAVKMTMGIDKIEI